MPKLPQDGACSMISEFSNSVRFCLKKTSAQKIGAHLKSSLGRKVYNGAPDNFNFSPFKITYNLQNASLSMRKCTQIIVVFNKRWNETVMRLDRFLSIKKPNETRPFLSGRRPNCMENYSFIQPTRNTYTQNIIKTHKLITHELTLG